MRTDRSPLTLRHTLLAAASLAVALVGCRQDMHNQPRYKPYGQSTFFADGSAMRQPVPGAVARGHLREDELYYTGLTEDGTFAPELPPQVAVTREVLSRGQERFGIFCAPCHGQTGVGNGMIVQRGFKQPTSFHDPRLRAEAAGYFFDVATNGFGQMSGYAAQVPVADRWAIVAYIRALQLSQNAPVEMLSAEDRQALAASGPPPQTPPTPDAGAPITDAAVDPTSAAQPTTTPATTEIPAHE